MYRCPVCGKENTALLCSCGFDISRDYEGYPTLAAIPAGQPSRRTHTEKFADMHRCQDCGGLLFYLNPVKAVCVCAHCGKEVPTGTPKANPTPVPPVKPFSSQKVTTYDAYMKVLEALYIQNGKTPLSLIQIQNFWTSYDLFNQLGITVGDIQRDLRTIAEKYQQYSNLASVLKQKSGKDAASLSSLLSQLGKQK